MRLLFYTVFTLVLAAFSALPARAAGTVRITNFQQLITSLNTGEQVRVVIHYKLCRLASDKEGQINIPDAVAGMDIDVYEYFAAGAIGNKEEYLVFSQSKLIQNPKGEGFVYNYGKVRVNADNSVIINAKYIHPKTYEVLMDQFYTGEINDGQNNEGVNFFVVKYIDKNFVVQ